MKNLQKDLLETTGVQEIPKDLKARTPEEPASRQYTQTALKTLLVIMIAAETASFASILFKCEMPHQKVLATYFFGITLILTFCSVIAMADNMRL